MGESHLTEGRTLRIDAPSNSRHPLNAPSMEITPYWRTDPPNRRASQIVAPVTAWHTQENIAQISYAMGTLWIKRWRVNVMCLCKQAVVGLGNVDHSVPLNQLNVLLQLLHGRLHPLLPGLLGGRVCHHAQPLVLVVELLPILLQPRQQLLPAGGRAGGQGNEQGDSRLVMNIIIGLRSARKLMCPFKALDSAGLHSTGVQISLNHPLQVDQGVTVQEFKYKA